MQAIQKSQEKVDKIFITTAGVGVIGDGINTSGKFAKPGDKIIVTGDIGRHGTAILLARDEYGIEAEVDSDCAPLWEPVRKALEVCPECHKRCHKRRSWNGPL